MSKLQSQKRRRQTDISRLQEYVYRIDPDSDYGTWITVLMVIFNETGNTEEGFQLADRWSSEGHEKYKGTKDVWSHWRHFKLDHPKPARLGTLIRMVEKKRNS
ncbi:MAG: hypothetical protein FIB06_03985 [Betaproteobacteria bacterium]|nr:hypothetical protein [Betaproteobacteria bacterium]